MIAGLSSPVGDMKDHYEVVVIGSGYGGAITASRLARAGRQVLPAGTARAAAG
jgi:cholesterol oxidase